MRVVEQFLPSGGGGRRLLLAWLWFLISTVSCGERPQVVLRFLPEDLAELDTLELALLDQAGGTIARPRDNPVSITDLLQKIEKLRAGGIAEPTISIYLNQEVQVPFNASVRFVGRGLADCTIAEGQTTTVLVSQSGQTLDVRLSFSPRLILNQRSEAPPRPGQLAFAVSLEPSPAVGAKPDRTVCQSKTRPNAYYVPKSSQVRVSVRAEDSFTVFDGWDDQDCPAEGECSLQRTQPIDEDTAWTAKLASWNCLKPDEFCDLAPIPERYKSAVRGQSGMSAWVAPNGDVWVAGLVGLHKHPSARGGIVRKWTGHNWTNATPQIPPWTRELLDISGTVDAGTIYVVGPDGIFSLKAANWGKGEARWNKENVSLFSAGAVWVGATDGVWAAGSAGTPAYPQIWHRPATADATWSSVGESFLKTRTGKTLHTIVGDDNGTLVASGQQGMIARISWPVGTILDLSPSSTDSLYASAWIPQNRLFAVASSAEMHLLSPSSSKVDTFFSYGKEDGFLFDLWPNQLGAKESLGLWATGSFAYIYRCDNVNGNNMYCSRVPSSFAKHKSLRRLVGPDLEHLWVVGYERDDPDSAAIQLGRYCPVIQCSRP